VLVWIYGGGLRIGSGSERLHHGDNLAAKGIILVTFNYRLGILGFMAHPELTKESPTHSSGNYGLMDQVAAIKWVHDNIAAFGGDPGRITIFGESAGGGSVSDMQATPLNRGMLHGAIAESGGSFSPFVPAGMPPLAEGEQNGVKFVQSMGAASIAEMRAIPAEQIVRAAANSRYGMVGAVVDGYVLPQNVRTIFSEGRQNDIPVLVGSNANEGTTLRMGPPAIDTPELKALFDKFYTPDKHVEIGGGFMLWCMHTWAGLETKTGTHKAYEYYFSHTPPFPEGVKFEQNVPHLGAFHSSEIIYVFDNLSIRKGRNWPWSPWDWKLADIMSSYWVNFAATGDPNGVGLPVWPAYSEDNTQVMNFDDTVKVIPLPRTDELKLWDTMNHFDFNAISSTH
jgi:para-nitrobenzyl esterase